jgi:hypothetical protein
MDAGMVRMSLYPFVAAGAEVTCVRLKSDNLRHCMKEEFMAQVVQGRWCRAD